MVAHSRYSFEVDIQIRSPPAIATATAPCWNSADTNVIRKPVASGPHATPRSCHACIRASGPIASSSSPSDWVMTAGPSDAKAPLNNSITTAPTTVRTLRFHSNLRLCPKADIKIAAPTRPHISHFALPSCRVETIHITCQ